MHCFQDCTVLLHFYCYISPADVLSPKLKNRSYPWYKTEDVTKMLADDDNLSVSSDSTFSSEISGQSGPVRRSQRNTPVRDILQESKTGNDRKSDSGKRKNDEKRIDGLSEKKINKSSEKEKNQFDLKSTPTKDSSNVFNLKLKRCRTDPRRKSIAGSKLEDRKLVPQTEVKVKRTQSVLLKKIGNEYKSFRNPTPDSEGRRTRTCLKFTEIKNVNDIKNAGRQAFSQLSNVSSPNAARKSPRVRSARLK